MKRREFITLIGGAAASPLAARAQAPTGKIHTVGILWHAGNRQGEEPNFTALMEGFDKLGYVDGKNIRFVHRFPNEMPERFSSMAAELVAMNPDVLIGIGVTVAPYLKAATSTIPIVFTLVADPVANKLVETLAKPGGQRNRAYAIWCRTRRITPAVSEGCGSGAFPCRFPLQSQHPIDRILSRRSNGLSGEARTVAATVSGSYR